MKVKLDFPQESELFDNNIHLIITLNVIRYKMVYNQISIYLLSFLLTAITVNIISKAGITIFLYGQKEYYENMIKINFYL